MATQIGSWVLMATLVALVSSAQAVIKIEMATVKSGMAFINGNGAIKGAQITWEGFAGVTTANKNNGGFSFVGVLPADCTGTLTDGAQTIQVAIRGCTISGAPVPRTGQTTARLAGDDGDLEKGVPWPTPRFVDNLNGTVTDNLTGLIWPRDLDCVGANTTHDWTSALAAVKTLAHGNVECALTDGSVAGDWRLPNRNELLSLLDLGESNPALPASHPFISFNDESAYWSSTTNAIDTNQAWFVEFGNANVGSAPKLGLVFVTAVRGGS
jgi:hypothetical protein